MCRFVLIFIISLVNSFHCMGQELVPLLPESDAMNTSKVTATPQLAETFGSVVRGVVAEHKQWNKTEFVLKINSIKGGKVEQILFESRDIVVYDEAGIRKESSILLNHIGQELRFYEGGHFEGFPRKFWNKDSPVATKRPFGFYSKYIFLIPTNNSSHLMPSDNVELAPSFPAEILNKNKVPEQK